MTENIIVAPQNLKLQIFVQFLYFLSLLSAIVPFGAVNPIPLSAATVLACFAAVVAGIVLGPPVKTRWLFATALILAVATSGWIEIQTLSGLDDGVVNPIWLGLKTASLPQNGSISIQPADSIAALSFLAVPILTFLTGLMVIRSDSDARRFTAILAIGGGIFAVYGLVQFIFFPETNLFFPKTAYPDSLTATFVNRNTAGTFLGLVCLTLARYVWSLSREISLAALVQYVLSNRPIKIAGLSFLLLISFFLACSSVALCLTKSRGAIGSTVVAFLFLVCVLSLQRTRRTESFSGVPSRRKTLLKAALACGLVLLAVGILGGRVLLRAETLGREDSRYCVLPGILELAKTEPLLGNGFGSFRYAFPPYRDPQCGITFIWERAHNFYLDGFIGLGIAFVVILGVGILALVVAQVLGMRNRRRMRSYSALGLASFVLVSLHGLADFSLQIPGMAAYFGAIMAATSTVSLGRSAHGRS
ncbi:MULTISPECIES: O-antigen ligase family protein [unclassified Rhizobium]|uniref:O-antigen ligase family protein n=1 Tax=unclassified Rhizobium TaxID=2613769 RepID=UPI001ADB4F79|nr:MULTISPECIES: O-antigen ligase family protein [unclassified Rhizobium]MBO9099402.1 O-antigen ligase family protein [Rhizobium sp. L58/93]QXZ87110.1 O-antigen ligase family protein [Rhizobium sp. K1/93]QXZ92856.1 O-antigen ligase family protein [Rhizobium sp. K15/93]